MIIVQLLPDQVPKYWEIIKYVTVKANHYAERDIPKQLNFLLFKLLSCKAQCFIGVGEETRQVEAMLITSIINDKITDERSVFINVLYSFKVNSLDEWQDHSRVLLKLAKKHKCNIITTYSNNDRVFDILEKLGFIKRTNLYVKEL